MEHVGTFAIGQVHDLAVARIHSDRDIAAKPVLTGNAAPGLVKRKLDALHHANPWIAVARIDKISERIRPRSEIVVADHHDVGGYHQGIRGKCPGGGSPAGIGCVHRSVGMADRTNLRSVLSRGAGISHLQAYRAELRVGGSRVEAEIDGGTLPVLHARVIAADVESVLSRIRARRRRDCFHIWLVRTVAPTDIGHQLRRSEEHTSELQSHSFISYA